MVRQAFIIHILGLFHAVNIEKFRHVTESWEMFVTITRRRGFSSDLSEYVDTN